jgi:hypothetical protein
MIGKRLVASALFAGIVAGLAGCYEPMAYSGYGPGYYDGVYYSGGYYWEPYFWPTYYNCPYYSGGGYYWRHAYGYPYCRVYPPSSSPGRSGAWRPLG